MPGRRPRPPARPAARTPGAPSGREPTAGWPPPHVLLLQSGEYELGRGHGGVPGWPAADTRTAPSNPRAVDGTAARSIVPSGAPRSARPRHCEAFEDGLPLPWHAVGVMKRLAEEPTAHDRRPMFISVLSNAVSEYWSQPIRNSRGLPPMARGHPPDARCGWPISSPRRIPHTSSGTGRTRFAYLRLHNGRGSARRVMEFFVHPGPERPLAHRRSSRAANAVEHGERPGRELPTGRGESVKYRMHVAVKMGGTR